VRTAYADLYSADLQALRILPLYGATPTVRTAYVPVRRGSASAAQTASLWCTADP